MCQLRKAARKREIGLFLNVWLLLYHDWSQSIPNFVPETPPKHFRPFSSSLSSPMKTPVIVPETLAQPPLTRREVVHVAVFRGRQKLLEKIAPALMVVREPGKVPRVEVVRGGVA